MGIKNIMKITRRRKKSVRCFFLFIMPKISTKGTNMPESPIRKLVPYAEQAKKDGKKVYHLNIGQPDIETPQVALDAVKNFSKQVVEYSHSAGFESYRKGLASYYQSLDINVEPY